MAGKAVDSVSDSVSDLSDGVKDVFSGGNMNDNEGGGFMKFLWPLLLLLGLGALAMYLFKGCETKEPAVQDVAETTEGTPEVVADSTTAVVNPAVESIKVKLADGTELDANKGGVEDKLVAFVGSDAELNPEGDWFDFDNLNFDTGSANLTTDSKMQIGNLVAILKAYPNLVIKIGGYTDKSGDDAANLTLSQSRADAVVAALKAQGANAAQIEGGEGYGEKFAKVDEAASDEERRADRRTAVKVVKK
ncbi:MAG: hypothetical protein C4K58_03805 [Flavobacteriaceae bacterium]|nr:MAG: hypothetical protein C4K58_03805 [Flavobacteriaceae bacterium]